VIRSCYNTNSYPYKTHNVLCGQIVEFLNVEVTTERSCKEFRYEPSDVCCLYTPCIYAVRTTFRANGDNLHKRQKPSDFCNGQGLCFLLARTEFLCIFYMTTISR
jgi:hypothetical protein